MRRVGEFELCAKVVCKESHTEIPIILQILEVKLEFHRENRTHRRHLTSKTDVASDDVSRPDVA